MITNPTNVPAAIYRISIDVTETVLTGKWTGIERVVRRLCAELQAQQRAGQGPEIRLVVAIAGRFHELNEAGTEQLVRPAQVQGQQADGWTRIVGNLLSYVPPLLLGIQSFLKERNVRAALKPLSVCEQAVFDKGDLVLLLDSYWAGTSSIAAARHARNTGATIISTIYDLIPITHPEYMTRSLATIFPRRILEGLRASDGVIAISQYSADELRRWLDRRLPDLPVRPFSLGNDPTVSPRGKERAFNKRYTMVGTIEPRKGHDLVLDAFEQRWAGGTDCHLTIVGKIGWASPSTQARLTALKDQGQFRIVHNADDAVLAAILAQSDAVIMASKIEGFGLPIVEALALDIPVIASDIAIFREIGGNAILRFATDSSNDLVAAMEELEANPKLYRERARAFAWPSWNIAAQRLIATLEAMQNLANR